MEGQVIWYQVRITYFSRYSYKPETPVREGFNTALLGDQKNPIQTWTDTTWGEMLKRHDEGIANRSAQSFYAQVPTLAVGLKGQAIWV